jgi:hypothetical protein
MSHSLLRDETLGTYRAIGKNGVNINFSQQVHIAITAVKKINQTEARK